MLKRNWHFIDQKEQMGNIFNASKAMPRTVYILAVAFKKSKYCKVSIHRAIAKMRDIQSSTLHSKSLCTKRASLDMCILKGYPFLDPEQSICDPKMVIGN